MTKEEALTIEPCDCGMRGCDFFGGGVGDCGESFSRAELQQMLKEYPAIVKHLRKLLAPTRRKAT